MHSEINGILARIPAANYRRIISVAKPVALRFKDVLCEAYGPIRNVWFPRSGVLSAIVVTLNGRAIEAANIGKEGVFGWTSIYGAGTSPHKVIVQVPGEGLQMGIKAFNAEAEPKGIFHELILRYQSAFVTQVSQSVACNGLHSIRQRCCRWLLMSHDRVQADKLLLTHEFLAIMLGAQRPGVTNVLGSLKESGLIHPMRGSITILNRKGLEAAACDCYETVTKEYERLFAEFPLMR